MRKCSQMSYELAASLGRGATSEVFAVAGRDDLAIKRLHPHLLGDPRSVARFAAELERTRVIIHPNVARVHAIGEGFLVLERIHGETLAARLADGPLDEAELRALGAGIADGMAAVHARGIVHRDLKPANIMLAGGAPKIVDFGIARSLAVDALATGSRVGTPAYMAPEQWTTGMIAPAGDVWALGAILFEAATGRLPFDGFEGGRCPQLIAAAPPAGCSPALDRVIAACLERDPARRPTMIAVAEMLRTDERVTQDVGAIEPVALATKRRRWPVMVAIAGAIAAAAWILYPSPVESTAVPLPVLPEIATRAPASPPVIAPRAPTAEPAPAHHARRQHAVPIARRAGETLD